MKNDEMTLPSIQRVLSNKIPEITLRDYFASQVLSGMGEYLMKNRDDFLSIADSCYKIADAMIKRRKNNG